VLQAQKRTIVMLALVQAWWVSLLVAPALAGSVLLPIATLAALVVLPIVAMSLRFRSIKLGVYSVIAWQVYAAGFWPGLLRRRVPPTDWIASTVVQDAPVTAGISSAGP